MQKKIPGHETREPTYNLPAVWIQDQDKESARLAKYTLVDPVTVMATHLTETLRQNASQLLTRGETDKLLTRVRQSQPGLVEEIVPTILSVGDIQKVLQNLLREKVSIRNLEAVVEAIADGAKLHKDAASLTELARIRLAPSICQGLVSSSRILQVLTLDPALEQTLAQSINSSNGEGNLVIDPRIAEQMLSRIAVQAERMVKSNVIPVLLCAPELRRHIRALSERVLPHLRVLSMAEIPNNIDLRAFGTVSTSN